MVPSPPAEPQAAPIPARRVALVIGIGAYRSARQLANPVRDARAVEAALNGLGFAVTIETDRTRRRLLTAVEGFVEDHQAADALLIFFAGHGVQIEGRNFLLPADAEVGSAVDLSASAIALDDLLGRLAGMAPRRIVLLDACRNDPFGGAAAAEGSRGFAAIDDLAPLPAILPGLGRIGRADNTIYAFATAPGTTAEDGTGEHSPFTDALLAHLGKKGLEFGSIMKLVQMEVYERTAGRQLPYIEDALPDLFFTDTTRDALPERDRLLLAMARIDDATRAQVQHIAEANDIPLAPLYGALLAGGSSIEVRSAEEREFRLSRAAAEFTKVRAELKALASSDPEVSRLRQQAEHALSIGAFEDARAALTQAIAVDHDSGEQIEVRLKERNLSEAATLAARAGVARTRLDYRTAAADYGAAARIAERWDRQKAWDYAYDVGMNLDSHGYEFGDNSAFLDAIEAYHRALALAPREERPKDWASTLNGLGKALACLGERETDTSRLEQAAETFQSALSVYTREDLPLRWANIQNRLGIVSQTIGFRLGDVRRLEASVAYYRMALLEFTRERSPFMWAVTHNNLGNALVSIALLETGTERAQEAVEDYRAALLEHTREKYPLDWASTHHNLGITLGILGKRRADPTLLEQAIEAQRNAVLEWTQARMPLKWGMVQSNLAVLLMDLAHLAEDRRQRLLDQAVEAARVSLTERTRERAPLNWADSQYNLGLALRQLGEAQDDVALLRQGIDAFREALLEMTQDRVPLEWASAMTGLATTLRILGEYDNATERLEEAASILREVLRHHTREKSSSRWAEAQHQLGRTLRILGERRNDETLVRESVDACRAALGAIDREATPQDWARAVEALAEAVVALADGWGARHAEATPGKVNELLATACEACRDMHPYPLTPQADRLLNKLAGLARGDMMGVAGSNVPAARAPLA